MRIARRFTQFSVYLRACAPARTPTGIPGPGLRGSRQREERVAAIREVRGETASRSPDCAPSLRRTIPISALPEAESRVQSVSLDAVSMATESASSSRSRPAIQAGVARVERRRGTRRGVSRGEDSTEPMQRLTDKAKRRSGDGGCAASASADAERALSGERRPSRERYLVAYIRAGQARWVSALLRASRWSYRRVPRPPCRYRRAC